MTVLASNLRHIASMSALHVPSGKVEFDHLAGTNIVDAGEAEAFQGMVNGFSLRVEHPVLESVMKTRAFM